MRCLNCGKDSEQYLCPDCRSLEILDKIFYEISEYKEETCKNEFVKEYMSTFEKKFEAFICLPDIAALFNEDDTEYYWCRISKLTKDDRFEETANHYLEGHEYSLRESQYVINDLLDFYARNDFISPGEWCEYIRTTDNLTFDLYYKAAEYYGWIGEYDYADGILDMLSSKLNTFSNNSFLLYSPETAENKITKLKEDVHRYRTKKPYWPSTEERRRAVAMFYDEKGISYPRITSRPEKVTESDFKPIAECYEYGFSDYCAFWCSDAFNLRGVKCIYQIAAVKVANGEVVDTFESFIRPWDSGSATRKDAAKQAGVSLKVIESAEDVDLVMPKFFEFVGDSILVSTEALGNQAKIITRAARYAGMNEIKNEFYDLLDLAADISEDFDMENNTRSYLCSYFGINAGRSALEKALANKEIYDALIKCGEENE